MDIDAAAPVEVSQNLEAKKTKKKSEPLPGKFFHFINMNDDTIEYLKEQLVEDSEDRVSRGEEPYKWAIYDGSQVKIKASPEEIRRRRKIYRQEYRKKAETILKRMEKSKNPIEIEKRRAYNSRQEVKERKKYLSKMRRAALHQIRETQPDLYKKVMKFD
jgi:hypothetical protein